MRYSNPVIQSDYSDPDVIRVGPDFYMVASSFNHVPGVPVLHSKNLAEWRLVNYVLTESPFRASTRCNTDKARGRPRSAFITENSTALSLSPTREFTFPKPRIFTGSGRPSAPF